MPHRRHGWRRLRRPAPDHPSGPEHDVDRTQHRLADLALVVLAVVLVLTVSVGTLV